MLLVYRQRLRLDTGTLEALFGVYALGLIPGLLLAGPLSDARGRRPVIVASAVLSLAGTVALMVAGHDAAPLYVGRFLTGLGSGAAFGAGTAWLRELSRPPFGDATDGIALTAVVAMLAAMAGVLVQPLTSPATPPCC
jgi:MFS family permease